MGEAFGVVLRWYGQHRLRIGLLPADHRPAAYAGLVTAVVAAAILLLAWWTVPEGGWLADPSHRPVLYGVVSAGALAGGGVCVALLGSAGLMVRAARPRALLRWTLVALSAGVAGGAAMGVRAATVGFHELDRTGAWLLAFVPGWLALAGVFGVAAAAFTPLAAARRRPLRYGLCLAAGPLGAAAAGLALVAVAGDWIGAVGVWAGGLVPLALLSFVAVGGLVLWLKVETVRLSRDAGVLIVRRLRPGPVTVLAAVAVKLAAVFVVLVVLAEVFGEPVGGLSTEPVAWIVVAGLGALTFVLLSFEHRLAASEDGVRAAGIGVVGALVVAIVPAVLFVALQFAVMVTTVLTVGIAIALAAGAAILAVRAPRARARAVRLLCAGGAPAAGAALVVAEPVTPLGAATETAMGYSARLIEWGGAVSTMPAVGAGLIGLFAVGLVGFLVYVARHSRSGLAFVVAFLVWTLPMFFGVAHQTFGSEAAPQIVATPIGYDFAVTAGVLLLAAAALRWRGPSGVTPGELLLLLVVVGVVAYGDVLVGLLGPAWGFALAPVALITPVVMQLMMDADALNARARAQPELVVGVLAAAAMALVLASAAVALVSGAGFEEVNIAQIARPVFVMPFAVMLVALTRMRGALGPAEPLRLPPPPRTSV